MLKSHPKERLKQFYFWIDRNAETILMRFFYGYLSLIIFLEVVRRFFFKVQTTWGAPTAIYAFIWLSWIGCSHNIRERTHLRFPGFRAHMSHTKQFLCFLLDDLIWLLISIIVLISSIKLLSLQISVGQTIEGTDNIPQWIATLSVPVGFCFVVFRVVQDIFINIRYFRYGQPFMKTMEEETAEELEQY
jgi:TRAP-type C4-dicarboxylate transport system permease small subunit